MNHFTKYSISRQPSAVAICTICTNNLNLFTFNIRIIKKQSINLHSKSFGWFLIMILPKVKELKIAEEKVNLYFKCLGLNTSPGENLFLQIPNENLFFRIPSEKLYFQILNENLFIRISIENLFFRIPNENLFFRIPNENLSFRILSEKIF